MWTYVYPDELYHHGVKGMEWGVRRYQNKDGSLTPAGKRRLAKDLKRDYKNNYSHSQPYRTSDNYKKKITSEIEMVITDNDKARLRTASNRWYSARQESDKADRALGKLAKKHAQEYYDAEIRKNGGLYETPRAKTKLKEFAEFEYGWNKAREERPDLDVASKAADKYWTEYKEECRKVSDKILGKYGHTKLHNSKYTSLTIRDTIGDRVMSMDSRDWK